MLPRKSMDVVSENTMPPPYCTCGYFTVAYQKASKNETSFDVTGSCSVSKLPDDKYFKVGSLSHSHFI